jgi:hypothetical protein
MITREKISHGEGDLVEGYPDIGSRKRTSQSEKMASEEGLSVEGESPCGQVDFLLASKLLRPRQKVLNMDTDFLLDLIKIMKEREGERYVPYERRLSLQSLG